MGFEKRVPKNYYEDIKGGRLEEIFYDSVKYYSDKSKVTKRALVYVPEGYDGSGKNYNVLYLMHGGGGNEEEIMYCQNRSLQLKHILDHMIANGDIEPMLVVTPTFYYSDSQSALHDIKDAGVLTKLYHNEFRNDLLPAIDSKYRTIADRDHRAFSGFSMGSEVTWEMYLNCLDLIKNFMPLSGDCWIVEEKGGATYPEKTAKLMKEYIKDKGFDNYSYNVFAFTGDKDIAFPALDPLIKAMLADGFNNDNDKRLRYCSWEEGIHTYEYGYEYLYNLLPEIFK
ncbi:MAG: hypothetical protein K6B41_15625 [Butyrivibrio sp.]|nr:hypothetical protein [Butyrivibrio sp.]